MTLREIDALVATKVMGWHMSNAGTIWLMSDGKYTGWDSKNLGDDGWHWNPTEDITAAWQVVEKMRDRGWLVELSGHENKLWEADLDKDDEPTHWAQHESVSTAICIAALRAVGCEVEAE